MTTIENARIKSTRLGKEDHGIFTCYIHLEYNGSGQSFGGYGLDRNTLSSENGYTLPKRIGSVFGMTWIMSVLRVLEVDSYESLPGTVCRVKREDGLVVSIGHFMKEHWFDPKVLHRQLVEAGIEKDE